MLMKKVRKLIYYALIIVAFVLVGIVVDDCSDDRKEYMIGVSSAMKMIGTTSLIRKS